MTAQNKVVGPYDPPSGRSSRIHAYDQSATLGLLQNFAGLKYDEHGKDTPKRFLSMLDELTQCRDNSDEHRDTCIKWKAFPSESDEMIIVEAIPFVSVCNHHVVPFIGVAHIAYVPDTVMAGLSKFGRVVQHFARQLQVQERLTKQVADYLEGALHPRGIGVIIRAEHMCMTIRGLRAPGTYTTTSSMRGVFADHDRTAKVEFLAFVNGNGKH
jgi:GTP cyclohydrolase I